MYNIRLLIIIIISISCQLIDCQDITYPYTNGTDEGDYCTLEDGATGICKKLPECDYRLQQLENGSDFTGRCGFVGSIEVVCCPFRPAEAACYRYQPDHPTIRVVNGEPAHQGEFPFMVYLQSPPIKIDENAPYTTIVCGGSLISVKHVLTAAHCVDNGYGAVPDEVRLGIVDLNNNEGEQRIPIDKIIVHPTYRRGIFYNDVAILKLKFRVQTSPTVWPICLKTKPVALIDITSSTHFKAMGWGATSFNDSTPSDQLMKTLNLSIVKNEVCNESYVMLPHWPQWFPDGIISSLICMINSNSSDACKGDSGGPLVMLSPSGSSQIGITAFGWGCGTENPGVYTAVYPFLNWIEEQVWPTPPSE